jgi:hypothetical protein
MRTVRPQGRTFRITQPHGLRVSYLRATQGHCKGRDKILSRCLHATIQDNNVRSTLQETDRYFEVLVNCKGRFAIITTVILMGWCDTRAAEVSATGRRQTLQDGEALTVARVSEFQHRIEIELMPARIYTPYSPSMIGKSLRNTPMKAFPRSSRNERHGYRYRATQNPRNQLRWLLIPTRQRSSALYQSSH